MPRVVERKAIDFWMYDPTTGECFPCDAWVSVPIKATKQPRKPRQTPKRSREVGRKHEPRHGVGLFGTNLISLANTGVRILGYDEGLGFVDGKNGCHWIPKYIDEEWQSWDNLVRVLEN